MPERSGRRGRLAAAGAFSLALIALVVAMPAFRPGLHQLFPELREPIYARASFVTLTIAHLQLVAIATGFAAAAGIAIGIAVTREAGRAFAPLARTVGTIGQTFPPVAVLALAVPLLGYGSAPTLAALSIYAALPVLEATLSGLGAVPADARDAAKGLGFSAWTMLWVIELPLAWPLMLTGLRNATIINVGTATIGSSVGALSLGSPILEGLSASNPAFVIEGAVVVALLAITIDRWFDVLEDMTPVI
ncbi:ABC transporter permease [Beijerinckia sp. L45]|uniref:ABC transporter permease n=1 Tax=Beijerinckia sp. L45 TaxID=1641855 RepID=UPI00131E5498|nr:ABC transporter permease [Beijerinckia sp. L45]